MHSIIWLTGLEECLNRLDNKSIRIRFDKKEPLLLLNSAGGVLYNREQTSYAETSDFFVISAIAFLNWKTNKIAVKVTARMSAIGSER